VPSPGERASAGNLRAQLEGRRGSGGDIGEFGVELLVDGGLGLAGRGDADRAVLDL